VAWATEDDVEAALGLPPASITDADWLTRCVAAANDVAFRRRHTAGYIGDRPDVLPDAAVALGTTQYAVLLYKQRGAVDGTLPVYDDFSHVVPTGATWTEILRLWGCNRPAVG
jgi:hypothetical protein